jgi:hypothetical protein
MRIMHRKVPDRLAQKKRNLEALTPLRTSGAIRHSRVMTSGEWVLEREMRTVYAAIKGADGTSPSRAFYDIAEGRQHTWRTQARRIIEAHDAGVHPDLVHAVVDVWHWWIDRIYGKSYKRAA